MTTSKNSFLLHLFIFHVATTTSYAQTCPETMCPGRDLPIRFPFRLKDNTNQRCGYDSTFELSCNNQNQTIIPLPTGEFSVNAIDYSSGEIWVNDPRSCLAGRFLETNFTVGPLFRFPYYPESYIFLNCTPNVTNNAPDVFKPVPCLSGPSHAVVAVSEDDYVYVRNASVPCVLVSEAAVPVRGFGDPVVDGGDVVLAWDVLGCEVCELQGGTCGFVGDTGWDVGCNNEDYPPLGPPQYNNNNNNNNQGGNGWVKLAFVLPMVSMIFSIIFCFTCNSDPPQTQQRSVSTSVVNTNTNTNTNSNISNTGLDRTTIESYPKTVLRKLLDPDNNTCSICLSEYNVGETTRTIPSCQYFFHVRCIDEWLRKSETCPLCRNFPLLAQP